MRGDRRRSGAGRAAAGTIVLLACLSVGGCLGEEDSVDERFELPPNFTVEEVTLPAVECPAAVEHANAAPAGSDERAIRSGIALDLSAIQTFKDSREVADLVRQGGADAAGNVWGLPPDAWSRLDDPASWTTACQEAGQDAEAMRLALYFDVVGDSPREGLHRAVKLATLELDPRPQPRES